MPFCHAKGLDLCPGGQWFSNFRFMNVICHNYWKCVLLPSPRTLKWGGCNLYFNKHLKLFFWSPVHTLRTLQKAMGKILKEYFAAEFHYSWIMMRMGYKDTKLEARKYLEHWFPNLSARKNHLGSFKKNTRASLVVQWLRICLLMQGTRVQALVWEDPTCHGATRPVSHNYWAWASGACAPQQERPR